MSDAALGYFAKKEAFNAKQGYRIDYKYLGMAYGIELAVVSTSLLSAWFFAKIYGHNDFDTMAMMMLAPVAYAGIEIARVPLALALRTQPSWFWKLVFAIMVLCAVAVSVKSLSQLGEVMFRPRLIDVTRATAALKDAESTQAAFAGKVRDADAVVAQRTAELADAETRLKAVNTELGALPADKCSRVWHLNSLGRRYSTQECHTDGRQKVMSTNLSDAQATRAEASDKLDAARKVRDALDATAVAKGVADAELKRRDAILNSQLHSFTGMFFGKDPTEVTEAELHSFLRIFVFFPAIFASLAATALALASVTPLREPPEALEVDEQALVDQLLSPLTRTLDAHAEKAANIAVAKAVVAQKIEPQAPDIPAQPAAPVPPDPPAATETAATAGAPPEPTRPFGPTRPTLVATNPPPGAA
jgi:hypothetical protein